MDKSNQQADEKERFENYQSSGLPLTNKELFELITSRAFWVIVLLCLGAFIAACKFFL